MEEINIFFDDLTPKAQSKFSDLWRANNNDNTQIAIFCEDN